MSNGFKTRLGLQREAITFTPTYPAAAAAPVVALLPILGEQLADHARLAYATTRASQGSVTHATVVASEASAPFSADLTYAGFETLWACTLGFMAKRHGATVFPEQLAVGAYRHRYEIDTRLQGEPWKLGNGFVLGTELVLGQRKVRRATVAAHRGAISVWQALSAMVSRVTLQGAPGKALQLSVDMIAHSVSNVSMVNTPETLAALAVPTAPRVLFHHSVCRLAPYSASVALDSGDAVRPQALSVTLDNGLARVNGRLNGLNTAEPDKAGATTVTGAITLPRYTVDTLILAQRAGTPHMMTWVWIGREIAATGINYQLALYFPSVHFDTTDVASSGPGRLPLTLSFAAREPAAAAAGFPAQVHGGALVVEVVSGVSTNPLLS